MSVSTDSDAHCASKTFATKRCYRFSIKTSPPPTAQFILDKVANILNVNSGLIELSVAAQPCVLVKDGIAYYWFTVLVDTYQRISHESIRELARNFCNSDATFYLNMFNIELEIASFSACSKECEQYDTLKVVEFPLSEEVLDKADFYPSVMDSFDWEDFDDIEEVEDAIEQEFGATTYKV